MAKTKATKKPSKQAAPVAAEAPVVLLSRLPGLDAPHRDAFHGQFTDADCVELGKKTKSSAVRDGAVGWAAIASPSLLGPHAEEIDYTPERLAWLVELLVLLDSVRGASKSKVKSQTTARSSRDVSREKVKALRKRLASKVSSVVKGNAVAQAALADTAAAPTDEALLESLTGLTTQATELLASTDVSMQILVKSARLTAADVAAATALAKDLRDTASDVVLGGRATGESDTPEVNSVEGRVTHELRLLRDAFEAAKSRGVPVPALIVPANLRSVLAHSHPKAAKPA